ncbi:cytochrome c oxidase subunit 3 [Buchnera aphidicola (Kurisakia onigurumii)]|uniref:cytochrome c oxidase subunit 3 n=1 Tax=Buchnera aphidicola TaxID=9 RepID=UPI0031B691CB
MTKKIIFAYKKEKENSSKINLESKKILGFWLYLMSDCIIFASFFSVYFVIKSSSMHFFLNKNTISLKTVFLETLVLLFSSFSCGISFLHFQKRKIKKMYYWLFLTLILGLLFLCIEVFEMYNFIKHGFSPQKNGLLSSIFTLLSVHAIHIFSGLIWIIFIISQTYLFGINKKNYTNFFCFSLFWHFLDIIWLFLYSFIYLIGLL